MNPVNLTPALRGTLKGSFIAVALLLRSAPSHFASTTSRKPETAVETLKEYPGLGSYLDRKAEKSETVESVLPDGQKERYPWRTQIVTTTFWVGERATKRNPVPNHASSWDQRWSKNFGGFDDPNDRNGYLPAKFVPKQNPFYCALPYNDTTRGTTKPEASKVIPWFSRTFQRPGKSVLKGRWVAIRFQNKIAYAQWEDCGPFRTDHWEYVFGNERPKANLNKGAGLDVSPAVRDYLGMKSTDVTDWRFVEFDEVPNGPWALHGENNTFVQNAREAERKDALVDRR